jgi:hypothetical protein
MTAWRLEEATPLVQTKFDLSMHSMFEKHDRNLSDSQLALQKISFSAQLRSQNVKSDTASE